MFRDPPYFEKGDRLYRQRMTLDHHLALAKALRTASNWVLSYDRSPVVESLYAWANRRLVKARYSINGRKSNWATNEELVIIPPGDSRTAVERRARTNYVRREALASRGPL
jgi:DNA adenine methylase